ncbi:MAG: ubiquinol-cytochrome c reductase iron-sulfur subunit [Microthrixaceae bacterium]
MNDPAPPRRAEPADDDRTGYREVVPVDAPTWKRDFPYEAVGEEEVTRREFSRYLVAGAGVMAAGNVGLAAWTQLRSVNRGEPEPIVSIGEVPVGETHLFRYPGPGDPAVLLRLGPEAVVAFSQKCTHLGCVVYYEAAEQRWHCPCHEGNFDAESGAVLSGPPPRPLGRIDVEVRDDGMIWALGAVEEHT